MVLFTGGAAETTVTVGAVLFDPSRASWEYAGPTSPRKVGAKLAYGGWIDVDCAACTGTAHVATLAALGPVPLPKVWATREGAQ